MSRFLETFCKIDVSRAKSQGPDLADLMNVSAPVLISADLCRMSQLACSFLMPKQRDSVNVSARVLISVDLCRMSQLACPISAADDVSFECLSSPNGVGGGTISS